MSSITVGSFRKLFSVTDFDIKGKIRTYIERRVDVDELEAACRFDLASHRAVFERSQHQLVVAPDQLVGPAPGLTPRCCVESEQARDLARVSARGSSICSID